MQETSITSANLDRCLKCGICVDVCPMLAVNPSYPGPKLAGPDGERYRIKDPSFFDNALKYCLNCKRCENSCPSGVRVADMIQVAKLKYYKSDHKLRDKMLASTDLVGPMASAFAPIANPILGLGVTKKALEATMGISAHRQFPAYSAKRFTTWLARHSKEQEAFPRHITYFHGCYVNYNYPQLGKDFVKIMNACGYGVRLMKDEKCCGVALVANGLEKQALAHARTNIKAISQAEGPVLATSSSCTYMIRDEYDHVLGLDNSSIRSSVILATKWLYDKIERGEIRLAFRDGLHLRVAYHTACHMQRLGWQQYSIELLKMIPGVELTVLEQNCCGISGTYGFKKENYENSQKVGQQLFDSIEAAAPSVVSTDCETCKWQIAGTMKIDVQNPISIIADALDIENTRKQNGLD